MRTLRTIEELQAALARTSAVSEVGLVPTMGAFHPGHLALFAAARAECDPVVVSLFVNPAQFEAADDLAAYPRDEERDARLAARSGADLLFAPSAGEMYPPGFRTWVEVENVSEGLEGAARPGHFRAVATVCLKLFALVRPRRAYFGQKDAQQAAVVLQLARDLEPGVAVRIVPTVRDPDGLACSSRNGRLSAAERARALALPHALQAGLEAHRNGADSIAATRAALDGLRPDYVGTLDLGGATVLAAAARVGSTRLLDNVILEGELP